MLEHFTDGDLFNESFDAQTQPAIYWHPLGSDGIPGQ